MPLVKKLTLDMFEMIDVASHAVNPVNLVQTPGAGLALEFRRRAESYVEPYREACRTGELRIGTILVIEDTGHHWDMICLPTKKHYMDQSDVSDITRGLEALREFLKLDKNRYSTVLMPMLGCGLGKQDYPTVEPLMEEYLGNLDATVILSMSPERTEIRPRYLTIAGPMDYGLDEKEQSAIDWGIDKALEVWGTKLGDYEGVVSGGYPGVDAYVCGTQFGKAVLKDNVGTPYQDTFVWRRTEKLPLVCKPNTVRNGIGANLFLGNLLCEIGDDIILFKPKGHNNNRLSAMQTWLLADKNKREREGLLPRRVAIFGERDPIMTSEDVLISVADIPY